MGSVSQVILLDQALCTPTVINVTKRIQTGNPIRVCSLLIDIRRYGMLFNKVPLDTMRFARYRDK